MPATAESLPLTTTHVPETQAAVAAHLTAAYENRTPVYPIGGGTSLEFGLPAAQPGSGLSLAGLNRVIDYPARDMTITVEAGITLDAVAKTLAAERQWLPVEGPRPDVATLGGLVASAWSGPRRYGYGTMRDYVIGVSAVDGRGMPFKAGGRVVKNVAGYDFCKLLTGSLGTLAVITQLTLKIRPLPERSSLVACEIRDWATAERQLAALVDSATTPVAVEILTGFVWREHPSLGGQTAGTLGWLVVGFEGTGVEVDWSERQLASEWHVLGVGAPRMVTDEAARQLWTDLREFSAVAAPLVLKASLLPSRVTQFVELLSSLDPAVSVQAHAGNGIVLARFGRFDAGDISRWVIGRLQPAAQLAGGAAVVLSTSLEGLTRQAVWGGTVASAPWMAKVKQQFDPRKLLNPGRFVYDRLPEAL